MTIFKTIKEFISLTNQNRRLEKEIKEKQKKLESPHEWVKVVTQLYGYIPTSVFYYGEDPDYINFAERIVMDKNNEFTTLGDFYETLKPIFKNKAFSELLRMLIAQQVHFIAHTTDEEQAVYSKATLNGYLKIERVLHDLEAYERDHRGSLSTPKLTPAEKFAVMGD